MHLKVLVETTYLYSKNVNSYTEIPLFLQKISNRHSNTHTLRRVDLVMNFYIIPARTPEDMEGCPIRGPPSNPRSFATCGCCRGCSGKSILRLTVDVTHHM